MSGVEVRRNFDLKLEVSQALDSIQYDALALKTIEIILEKTSSGVDFDNKPFVEYADFTKKVRKEKGLPTSKPDLFFTGNMLSGMTSIADNDGAVIGFLDRDSSNKAYRHVLGNGVPVRDFFFINDDDGDELLDLAMSFFDDAM